MPRLSVTLSTRSTLLCLLRTSICSRTSLRVPGFQSVDLVIEALDPGAGKYVEHPLLSLLTLGSGEVVRRDQGAEVFGLSCGLLDVAANAEVVPVRRYLRGGDEACGEAAITFRFCRIALGVEGRVI